MLLGLAVIFVGGLSWLTITVTHSMSAAVTLGFRWFIALDIVKVLAASAILPWTWKVIGRR